MIFKSALQKKVKEWAVARLKKGYSAIRTAKDIKQYFGVYVTPISVGRWRKQYNERNVDKTPVLRTISNVRKPEKAKELV